MKAWQIVLSTALLLSLFSFGNATILSVALDGSQPYTVIQEAINTSAHGDTVLVYPGRYYENIRFYGKNISLASLELTTGNLDYKYSTIIDGSNSQEVIKIVDYEDNVTIRGFTITNGNGSYVPEYDTSVGGGIIIARMSGSRNISLINCVVCDNHAEEGGGIWASTCNLFLSGVSILRNIASSGGGIKYTGNSTQTYRVTFDSINRSSIYSNRAAFGCDMYFYQQNSVAVVVDTFTVANPSNFYAAAVPANSNIENPYTFDILHSVHTEVNHDLYVAPWGDDANDGLSEASPLKTVFQAVYNIASDPVNPKTVHLADGYYSKSLNQQLFPVPIKKWTTIMGHSRDNVILDMEMQSNAMSICPHSTHVTAMNLAFMNCKGGIGASYSDHIALKNIDIRNIDYVQSTSGYSGIENAGQALVNFRVMYGNAGALLYGISTDVRDGQLDLKDISVSNLRASEGIRPLVISGRGYATAILDGVKIFDNLNTSPDYFNTLFQISPYDNQCQSFKVEIKNSLFANNQQSNPSTMALVHALNDTTFVRNCTFAGSSGGSSALTVKGNAVFENNIFWNPQLPYELTAYYSSTEGISGRLEFDNNCIRNGLSGIYNMSPLNEIVWHDNNLAIDPQFVGSGSHPYRLSAASPLIDIGLQPAFLEPSYDAGGNERVWDGDGDGFAVIDLGAYEYQPIASPYNLGAELWNQQILLGWQMPDGARSLTGFRIYRNNQAYADILDPGCRLFRDYSPVNDTLSYFVVALYGVVESEPTNSVTVIVSGVANSDETAVPAVPQVSISPNPFSDIAVISYELAKQSEVELKLYNLKGQLVRTLHQGSQSKGFQTLAWEGCDDSGRYVASGVYILQLYLDGKAQKAIKLVKW